MKRTSILLGSALVLSLMFSCNDVEPVKQQTNNENFANIGQYFSDNTVSAETFQFTAENGGSFTTAKGSKVTIPADAFVTRSGQPVTGPIDFKIKEVFSTADMMFSGVFPVSYDQVLNSGGEFYLEAKSSGQKVLVKDGKFLNVVIPAQAEDQNMMLFLAGEEEDQDSLQWQAQDSIGRNGFTFNSADKTYSIDLDSMGWANIDAFNWNIKYYDCTFNLTGLTDLSNENTTAFAVFKDQNAVWPVGVHTWGDITNNVISENHLGNVAMNLLVISVKDGDLYFGMLDLTPEEGKTYDIALTKTTSDDLDALIKTFE